MSCLDSLGFITLRRKRDRGRERELFLVKPLPNNVDVMRKLLLKRSTRVKNLKNKERIKNLKISYFITMDCTVNINVEFLLISPYCT